MQHTEGKFLGRNNLNLYYQSWAPDGVPTAVLIVVHGIAEHSGRYSNLVNYFVPKGYAIYSFDLRGHGKSEGKRGYVERFSYYLDDVKTYYDMVRQENKSAKIFLVGFSMGGTIATAYAINHQSELNGLILSGAVLKLGASVTKLTIFMGRVFSLLTPKMGITALDTSALSRDKAVAKAYVDDPWYTPVRLALGLVLSLLI